MTVRARVLVVRLSAMGDVVQTLGAIEALALARPEWEVHAVVQTAFAPLFENLAHVASVIRHARRPAVLGFLRTARRLRQMRFDLALDLQGNGKSAAIARACGAPRCVGIAAPWRRERWSAWFLRERVAASGEPHPARLAYAVVRAVAEEAIETPPRVVATDAELVAEAARLAQVGIDAELPFSCHVLGDPADNRSWPAAQAARAASACPWPVLTLLGPSEPEGMSVPSGQPLLRHGPGELRRLVALGALIARAGGTVVGPDQGPTHVLAAAGADTTVLYGPQDPRRTAPPRARVLVRADGPSCVPCRRRRCDHPDGPVCMQFAPGESATPPRP